MQRNLILIVIFTFLLQTSVFSSDYYSKSRFRKLPQSEQIKVLKQHKEIQLDKIDSKIKDINAQMQSLEQNTSMQLSKKQSMTLKFQQELTTLQYQRSEIIERYDYKINLLK